MQYLILLCAVFGDPIEPSDPYVDYSFEMTKGDGVCCVQSTGGQKEAAPVIGANIQFYGKTVVIEPKFIHFKGGYFFERFSEPVPNIYGSRILVCTDNRTWLEPQGEVMKSRTATIFMEQGHPISLHFIEIIYISSKKIKSASIKPAEFSSTGFKTYEFTARLK